MSKTAQKQKTRIVVFEDNAHLRDMLYFLINSSDQFTCVNTHRDCRQVLQRIEEDRPSIVVMDIELPGINGIEATKLIKEHYPDIQILILTVFEDNERIFQSICAGGSGYLLKTASPEEILQALTDVEKGGSPLSPSVARRVVHFFQNHVPQTVHNYKLTGKEREVLQHLANGKSYKMIGDEMGVSLETIKSHVKSIYKKLHVNSSSEAIIKAIRTGLV